MKEITMLACSLLPAILLICYVRYRDRRHPEPMMRIAQAVIYGLFSALLSVPLAMALEGIILNSEYGVVASLPFIRGVFGAFVGAAIPEESAKLLMLWLMLRNCDDFDEAMDGIVYAVCIGMGFAGLENILYVFGDEDSWKSIAFSRSLLAVPGHYLFAVLMGFFYSLAHFHPRQFHKYRSLIWIAPVLAHGIYDSILMVGAEHEVLSVVAFIPLIAFCVWMHRFCFRQLRHAERLDTDLHDLATFCDAVRQECHIASFEQPSPPSPPQERHESGNIAPQP